MKKFYWLKMPDDFFANPIIKKLRKIAGGDTYTIIYQKLLLMSVSGGGILKFEGLEDELSDELALKMDENTDNVRITLLFMQQHDLIWELENNDYLLPEAAKNLGSESDAAKRMRELREQRKKNSSKASAYIGASSSSSSPSSSLLASHCDTQVTEGGEQCANNVRECSQMFAQCANNVTPEKEEEEEEKEIRDQEKEIRDQEKEEEEEEKEKEKEEEGKEKKMMMMISPELSACTDASNSSSSSSSSLSSVSQLSFFKPEKKVNEAVKVVIILPLNNANKYPIHENQVKQWMELYPAVDVMQQLRNMKGWFEANPAKQKTGEGILRFVNAWLTKHQDKGGVGERGSPTANNGAYTASSAKTAKTGNERRYKYSNPI